MPTYTYQREDGTTFEREQPITEDPLEECPETGQDVKRIVTDSPGIVYKTDGFHNTDYDSKNPGAG